MNTTTATTTRGQATRAIRRVALPAAAATGAITVAVTSGLPAMLGLLTFNHNETLLRSDRP